MRKLLTIGFSLAVLFALSPRVEAGG